MTLEQAKEHIGQIHREKREKDGEDLRSLLKIVAEELNSKDTHFIWELLQNAEDNNYDDVAPALSLRIEANDPTQTSSADGCLIVLNNEAGFQKEHVRGICSAGRSSKKRDETHDYIGEKGIGFKSVFRVTDSPHIFSNGYQFRFTKPETADELGYILPHWVEVRPRGVTDDCTTILLPLQPGKRALVAEELSKIAPESILFLRKLKRLEVGNGHSISRSDGQTSLVTLCSNSDESLYFVHRESFEKPGDLVEEKRQGISRREVTVAFPLNTSVTCKGQIFAFLPTKIDSGLPFLVNADFVLTSNREGVLENRRWNQWLRDGIAPTFVNAFLSVLNEPAWKTDAYRFLPIASDLTPGADFFGTIVGSVQERLKTEQCVLTKTGEYVLPERAHFASSLASRVLRDAPPARATVALLHPDLERHWERLKPLGVETLKFGQLFDACNDKAWLESRDGEWWETLFQLCTDRPTPLSAEIVGSFPILRCRDGTCRPLSCGVFFHVEGQPIPTSLPAEWPVAHLFDDDLQKRLQQKQAIWGWLTRVARLQPFSVQSYIIGSLLDWMRGQTGQQLIEATRFIAANLKHLDTPARQMLREKMTWQLADGRVLLPEARGGKELVTPECLENEIGWNLLFCALDRHFFVIHDDYCAGLSGDSIAELREVFQVCGATAFPDPRLRELDTNDAHYEQVFARCVRYIDLGTPKLRDWVSPGWLLGLENVEQTANGRRKVKALEKWLKSLKPEYIAKFLYCSKLDSRGNWQQIDAWSEFGDALHKKPWLLTSKGSVAPSASFLDTTEFREFFGDAVAYVATNEATPLLEKLGVRVRLTAKVLISRLREVSDSESPDLALLAKIYRQLQDSSFDVNLFRLEKLIFLSEPKPRWLSAEKLVWANAGELFDDDFGYVSQTYGISEHRFFTEKLKIPDRPELRHYATAWDSLCSAITPDRTVVERKLKVVLQRLADCQNELPTCDWWRELKTKLLIWTGDGKFQPPARVYIPDHSAAVELFDGRIHIAFPSKPNRTVLSFLRWLGCRSLASVVHTRLANTIGESSRTEAVCLTPASKELCVSLVCSRDGWQNRCLLLQALFETTEIGVTTITVEYSLLNDPGAGTQSQSRDAYWDVAKRRLLLRDGVDPESLRDAAAKSIAAEFFGEASSAEIHAEFFRLLTVSTERARKLMEERSNWRLTPQQQEWLREQHWQILITELDEVEPPTLSRAPVGPTPRHITVLPPVAQPHSAKSETATAQGTGNMANQAAPTAPGHAGQTTACSGASTLSQAREPHAQSATPPELHDANTITADFVEVRGYSRSRPQRVQSQPTQDNQREASSGLTTTSAEDKAALETCGREFAIKKLESSGYQVTSMPQHNPGFDLKAEKLGNILKVEVKAHAGEASSVFITQREYEKYLTTLGVIGETWELWNVENLARSSAKTPTIQRVGHIPDSAMKESGYWVDLRQCPQKPPELGAPALQ